MSASRSSVSGASLARKMCRASVSSRRLASPVRRSSTRITCRPSLDRSGSLTSPTASRSRGPRRNSGISRLVRQPKSPPCIARAPSDSAAETAAKSSPARSRATIASARSRAASRSAGVAEAGIETKMWRR